MVKRFILYLLCVHVAFGQTDSSLILGPQAFEQAKGMIAFHTEDDFFQFFENGEFAYTKIRGGDIRAYSYGLWKILNDTVLLSSYDATHLPVSVKESFEPDLTKAYFEILDADGNPVEGAVILDKASFMDKVPDKIHVLDDWNNIESRLDIALEFGIPVCFVMPTQEGEVKNQWVNRNRLDSLVWVRAMVSKTNGFLSTPLMIQNPNSNKLTFQFHCDFEQMETYFSKKERYVSKRRWCFTMREGRLLEVGF